MEKYKLNLLNYDLGYVSLFFSRGISELAAGAFLRWSSEAAQIFILLE